MGHSVRTQSQKWGDIGWEAKFWFKLRGWECYFWSSSERFKSRNLKRKSSKMATLINLSIKLEQKVPSCGSRMQKNRSFGESDRRATFHQNMCGLWVTAETISKNMVSLGDSSTENRASLEPYIRVTSIISSSWAWFFSLFFIRKFHIELCHSRPTTYFAAPKKTAIFKYDILTTK